MTKQSGPVFIKNLNAKTSVKILRTFLEMWAFTLTIKEKKSILKHLNP